MTFEEFQQALEQIVALQRQAEESRLKDKQSLEQRQRQLEDKRVEDKQYLEQRQQNLEDERLKDKQSLEQLKREREESRRRYEQKFEQEIGNILAVQRELQEKQLQLTDNMAQWSEGSDKHEGRIERLIG